MAVHLGHDLGGVVAGLGGGEEPLGEPVEEHWDDVVHGEEDDGVGDDEVEELRLVAARVDDVLGGRHGEAVLLREGHFTLRGEQVAEGEVDEQGEEQWDVARAELEGEVLLEAGLGGVDGPLELDERVDGVLVVEQGEHGD